MEAFLTADDLAELAAALKKAAAQPESHHAGVMALAGFFETHFPVLCEAIAETVRASGKRKLHYWCDVGEMSELANYHFTLE